MPTVAVRPQEAHHQHDLRWAWTWVVALPFVFAAGMVAGEGLFSAMGYEVGGDEPVPLGPALLVGLPVTLLIMAPGALAYLFGMRARHEGDPRGLLPALLGAAAAAFMLLTNVGGLLVQILG